MANASDHPLAVARPQRPQASWRLGAVLAVSTALAYLPASRGGFVYDDHQFFDPSGYIRGPLWQLWASTASPDWWPLTTTTFWLEWRLWGENAAGYHAFNVALHATAAILLWRVLLRLRVAGAWAGALLFALHPVAVESVAWISERKNVLSGALALAAALAWLRHDDEGNARDYALAVGLFALALLAKTSVVVVPPVLAAIVLLRRGRLSRLDVARLAPFFALALATGLVTVWFQWNNAMGSQWVVPRGPVERLAGAAWALGFYVQKAYLPMGLAFVYPRWPIEPESPLFLVPLGVAAVAAAAGWRLRASRARPVVLALAYQTVTVLPVLGLVEIAYFSVGPVSNHLQYLALLGPCALGGAALAAASARWPRASRMAAVLVLGLGASTLSRASAFKDDVTLWQRAAGDAPGASFAHERLAKELAERGRREEALASLIEVARLARDPAARCSALGYWHVYRGEYDAAIANAREAVRLKPVPPFRRDLGLLLVVTGHTAEALGIFQQLVLEYPRVAEYRYWLGRALEGEGDGGGTPDGRASRRPG